MNIKTKNKYVCEQITTSLLKLLEQKNLSEISVSEITTKAEVSRVSFYRNFSSKEEIISKYLNDKLLFWKRENIIEGQPFEEIMENLFLHIIDNKESYLLLYKKNLFYFFVDSLKQVISQQKNLNNIEAYAVSFMTYGLYGWIVEWLERGMQESASEISKILKSNLNNKK